MASYIDTTKSGPEKYKKMKAPAKIARFYYKTWAETINICGRPCQVEPQLDIATAATAGSNKVIASIHPTSVATCSVTSDNRDAIDLHCSTISNSIARRRNCTKAYINHHALCHWHSNVAYLPAAASASALVDTRCACSNGRSTWGTCTTASMVTLLTLAGTVQLTLGGLVEVVVKMISVSNWPWIVEIIVSFLYKCHLRPQPSQRTPYSNNMPVPSAKVVKAGILR